MVRTVTPAARSGVCPPVLRQDYLARQLAALFAALRRATERVDEDDAAGAMDEVNRGYTLLPGVDRSLLAYLSAEALHRALEDEPRVRALARLRATEALALTKLDRDTPPESILRIAHQALMLYHHVGLGEDATDAATMQRLLACIDHLEATVESR
ncbi:MAG: hypothetical protein AAGN82_30855 [Myxococcota bacterium]